MSPTPSSAPVFVDDYLPALLAQASHLISGEFHHIAAQQGFTVSEWRVLASLTGAAPMSVGDLAKLCVLKQPTVTRVVDRMEARGEVQRTPHKTDRRVTLIKITPKGQRLASGLIKLANAHEHDVLEPFGLDRARLLKETLKQMIALHADGPGSDDALTED